METIHELYMKQISLKRKRSLKWIVISHIQIRCFNALFAPRTMLLNKSSDTEMGKQTKHGVNSFPALLKGPLKEALKAAFAKVVLNMFYRIPVWRLLEI